MTANLESTLTANLQTAAQQAGLAVLSIDAGSDFNGHPTTRFRLATAADAPAERTLLLELSEAFDFNKPELLPEMTTHLREAAKRLRNPRPDAYVTLAGLPVSFIGRLRARTRTSCMERCIWKTGRSRRCTRWFPRA
jgi:outer membrane protein OmpA-like peptidoglycan-associated protein